MFDLITNVESCYYNIPHIIYYSHIPTALVAFVLGSFVFFRGRSELVNKLLFFLAIVFSLWSFLDLVIWTNYDSRIVMFAWSVIILMDCLIFIGGFYLMYVFISKRDVSFFMKLLVGAILSPFILFMSSTINVKEFDSVSCNAVDAFIGQEYLYGVEVVVLLFVIFFSLRNVLTEKDDSNKKKEILFSLGLFVFLSVFFSGNFIASIYETNNFLWILSQYGLFGVVVFMGFLAYLIVKYQAFNIKLIGAQALVFALIILIGSQFFFIQNPTNILLNGITLSLVIGFGYMLIKSVKIDIQRKEELQYMSDQLASKNDQLRKLDNAKSEFISIASHQLRTPLTAIKGFLSLMLEGSYGKLEPKHQEVLNKVYISAERLIALVEDLLNISRIESGRMEYKFDKWDLPKICSEIVDTFVLRAKERGFYLDYKLPEKDFPEVTTDGTKLREVVSNLIDNALKYTQRGGVSVRLSHEGTVVKIIVTDTGIGIPQTELPYLFSKFSRGKDTNRLNTGGTGLGLYVGKSIIEALGGKIWAESEGAGKGSRFIIELPIERTEEGQ